MRDFEGLIFLLLCAGLLSVATFFAPTMWPIFLIGLTLCLFLRAMGRLSFLSYPFLSFPVRFDSSPRTERGFEYLLNDALGRIMAVALILNICLATAILLLVPGSFYVFVLDNIPDSYSQFLRAYWFLPDPSWVDMFLIVSLCATVFWHYVLMLLYLTYAETESEHVLSGLSKVLGVCVFVMLYFIVPVFDKTTGDGVIRGGVNWLHSNEFEAVIVFQTIVYSMAALAATFLLFAVAFVLPARIRAALGYGKAVSETH